MKSRTGKLLGWLSLAAIFTFNASATVRYVDLNCANPTSPYTDWSTAATNIQNAIDASVDGDLVLVTNGVYQTGGRVVYGTLTNRVAINKAITVQSVNGPTVTAIQGYTAFDTSAVRCAYLTNGASLMGFILTNGLISNKTDSKGGSGSGVYCESLSAIVSNCIISGNSAPSGYGGGAFGGTLFNCILTNNSAINGGGTASNVLVNCTLAGNFGSSPSTTSYGAGAYGCGLTNCLVVGNNFSSTTFNGYGGGAGYSTLTSCIVSNNSGKNGGGGVAFCVVNSSLISSNYASNGGGAYQSSIANCFVVRNAGGVGGGVYGGTLNNCTVIGNSAVIGGGEASSTLINCTLSGNFATSIGGGAQGGTLNNCIVYYNNSPSGSNYSGGTFHFCCTIPQLSGADSFTNTPAFVNLSGGDFHLQSNSPCINAGNNSYVTNSTDLDGNPRIVGDTVDIGAYEYQTPSSILSYAWARQYGLSTDGAADNADTDSDGMNNYAEWKSSTNPTNATSLLQLAAPVFTNSPDGIVVTWQSIANATYYLQSSTNLPAFTSIASNLVGQAVSTSYTDNTATNGGPYFYRVGVQ